MAWIDAIILGIVQGLTEFLPVSSSGHLVIARSLMPAFQAPGVLFEVLVHVGTLAAVFLVFRLDVARLAVSLLPGGDPAYRRIALYIVAASIPTGFAGLLFKDTIHELFHSVRMVGISLLVTGVILYVSEVLAKPRFELGEMGWKRAFGVGVAQSVALMPGISRSGATISAGRLLGVKGEDAARFSFLISIPAIMGATFLEARHAGPISSEMLNFCLLGTVAAFFTGIASLKLLLFVVRRSRMRWFAAYCWAAGLTVLLMGL